MNLNLEIEQGSQADNIGRSLEQSTAKFGKDMVMSIGTGAANVVAATGINIGNGSTDQIIADNISAAINLTGEQGLTNLASDLEKYSQQLAAMGLNAPEQLVDILLGTINDVLGESGTISAIQKGLQVTTNTVDLAKKSLNYACSATTVVANIQKLLTKLNKMQDVDVTCVPSVKDSNSALSASHIQQLTAQYDALKQQLLVFYNSMICPSNDSVLDNIIVSINNILEVVEPALDQILQQNTGHTISEVRNICNQGFAYIGMIERAAASKRKEDQAAQEDAEKQTIENEEKTDNKVVVEASKLGNNLKNQAIKSGENTNDIFKKIGTTVSDDAKKILGDISGEAKEKFKKESIEKSKEKWKEKTKDLTKEEATEKLMSWLKDQPIVLQNAFHILVIKDIIDFIKTFIQQLQNISAERLEICLNSYNDIINIFKKLGIEPGKQVKGITIDDLKAIGMGVAGTVVDTAVNIGQQVQNNAMSAMQQMVEQTGVGSMVGGDNGAMANISDLSELPNEINETGNNVSNAAQGVTDKINSTPDSIINAVNNNSNQFVEITSDRLNSIITPGDSDATVSGTNIVKTTGVKIIPPFTYNQSNHGKNIYIDITINKRPSLHLTKIMSFIKSFKSGKDQIFNNGATKQIKNAFYDAWELDELLELVVNAKVDGVTKFYNFTFTVNKSERNNPDNDVEEIETGQLLSGAASGISSESQNLINNAVRMINNAGGQVTALTGNAASHASNLVNDGINAVSQLSKVDINIDMSAIEQVLQGKILIFDPIIKIIQILYPGFEAIKLIGSFILNYKVNKEFVRTKQHADLVNAFRKTAQTVMGLKDIIKLKDTNFFTIRTQKMADWVANTFEKTPDENGTIIIDIIGTTKLNTYCAINLISPECPLDLLKGTALYYDKWAIENGGYNDGTTQGLDNVEINRDLGEVYYDSKQRSTLASEILRARKRKADPNYVNPTEIETESNSIGDLLNLTEFTSDEMEGQQTLNLCNLNLCPAPPKPEKEPAQSAVIIEFGDEYTLGNSVDYNIIVKPGQTINKGDILAYITKGNVQQPIRTKFTGVVRGENDYTHLYPSIAGKHFIIDDYSPCMPVDYNIDDVMNLSKRFKMATELGAFILNCMPLSILPILLAHADRNNEVELQFGSSISGSIQKFEESFSKYNEFINNYDTTINKLSDELAAKSSPDNFNPTNSTVEGADGKSYYKIPINRNNEIYDDIMSIRLQMIDTAISTYNNALKIGNYIKGDYTYGDCIGLAFDKERVFTREVNDKKIDNINYYINILQNIPESKDIKMPTINIDAASINSKLNEMYGTANFGNVVDISNDETIKGILNSLSQVSNNTEENKDNYINEYRNIITEIVNKRLSFEGKDVDCITIEQFNTYYNKHILCDLYRQQKNPFEILKEKLQKQASLEDKDAILNQIKFDKLGKTFNLGDIKEFNQFKKIEEDKVKDDEEYYNTCQHALTMFVYLIHANINIEKKVPQSISSKTIKETEDKNSLIYAVKMVTSQYISQDQQIEYNDEIYVDFYELYNAILNNNKIEYVEEYNKHVEYEKDKIEVEDLTKTQLEEIKTTTIEDIAELINTESNIINYILDGYDVINNVNNNLDENTLLFFNRKINEEFYKLTCEEANTIEAFWKKVLAAYNDPNGKYNLDNVIKDIKGYADKMNSYAKWPTPINIKVDNTNYELYTFADRYEDPKSAPEEIIVPADMGNVEIPDPVVDLNNLPEPRDRDKITIMDYEYWLVYMLNATLFTLIPTYWADGFDIPPFMTPTPLPAIYLPIAPPIMIPVVNVLMVFGIALRGIWPMPIILMVNLSSSDIDAMVFIKMSLEIAKDIFKKSQELVENGIPMMVNKIANNYISENQIAQKAIEKFKTYSSIIHAIPIENKALIEKKFNEALVSEMNKQTKLNDANRKLENTKNKLKNFDRRQVITRESDLGNGPEPM